MKLTDILPKIKQALDKRNFVEIKFGDNVDIYYIKKYKSIVSKPTLRLSNAVGEYRLADDDYARCTKSWKLFEKRILEACKDVLDKDITDFLIDHKSQIPMEIDSVTEDFKALNEQLEQFLEAKEYELAILEGRARDLHGNLEKHKFTAKNDLDALIQIFKKYDLQNSFYFTEEDLEEEYGEEYVEKRDAVLKCLEENKIDEGVKLITEIYYDDFDPSDYYDNIIKLTAPDGHIVFEDDGEIGLYDDEEAYLDSDDEEWDEDEEE